MTTATKAVHTPGPWLIGWNYWSARVNEGDHPDWTPDNIPLGECAFCRNPSGVLIHAYSEDGKNFHMHRFVDNDADNWRDIYAGDGTQIIGNYDYEEGGVCTNEADARLIAAAPEMLEALEALDRVLCDNSEITDNNVVYWMNRYLPEMDAAVKAARAAIRKARGEQ